LCVVLASKLVEHRLTINYGKVFQDTSGHGQHGVNGNSSNDANNDAFPAVRVVYFFIK